MKWRKILLSFLALIFIGFLSLLIVILTKEPVLESPLTVQFAGYTNSASVNPAVILKVRNHSKRNLEYIVYPAQQRGPEGWPEELPWSGGLLIVRNLLPRVAANEVVILPDNHSPFRVPIYFHFAPTWRERARERIQTAIHARSLKPLWQRHRGYAMAQTPDSFVFSEELPALDSYTPPGRNEAQE